MPKPTPFKPKLAAPCTRRVTRPRDENAVDNPVTVKCHLLEISKLQLTVTNLVHKGVDLYVQNALKLNYRHL